MPRQVSGPVRERGGRERERGGRGIDTQTHRQGQMDRHTESKTDP